MEKLVESAAEKPQTITPAQPGITAERLAVLCSVAGTALGITGVYLLAGTGWAMIAASAPLLLLAAILIRGLVRAG